MEKDTVQVFCNVLKCIYTKENSERYHSICTKTCNEMKKKIWKFCEKFWHPEYSYRTANIERYELNPNLDNATVQRYLKELTQLLDKFKAKFRPGDTLIVTKLDRFVRSASQGSQMIESLIAQGITVHILNLGVMDNTPTGKLI